MKKRHIVILSLIIVVLSMSCVSAGLFDGLFGGDNNDKNITLIKESTEINRKIYDDGEVFTSYSVSGVLKDLPNNLKGYDLKILVYDDNNSLIKEDDGFSIKSIAKSSKESEPSLLGVVYDTEYNERNADYIELKIYNPDGDIVFDKNITVDLDTMDIHYETKSVSSSGDSLDDDSKGDSEDSWINDYFDRVEKSGLDKDN